MSMTFTGWIAIYLEIFKMASVITAMNNNNIFKVQLEETRDEAQQDCEQRANFTTCTIKIAFRAVISKIWRPRFSLAFKWRMHVTLTTFKVLRQYALQFWRSSDTYITLSIWSPWQPFWKSESRLFLTMYRHVIEMVPCPCPLRLRRGSEIEWPWTMHHHSYHGRRAENHL